MVAGVEGELNDLFVGGVTGFGLDLKSSMVPVGIAEDRQILRDAETRRDEVTQRGDEHGVLGHLAVGRPLAARHGDHVAEFGNDGVFARNLGGRAGGTRGLRIEERTQAGEGGLDVGAGDRLFKIAGGRLDHEVDFGVAHLRIEVGFLLFHVGRADEEHAVPGNGEEHAAVAGLRDEHAGVAGHEGLVEQDVRAAGDAHERGGIRINHAADRIDPGAGGVEDHLRADDELFAGFLVLRGHGADHAAFTGDANDGHVVERYGAVFVGRANERNVKTRVVELAVEELHAPHQAFGLDAGQAHEGVLTGEARRVADVVAAVGHGGVDAEADRVELALALLVAGQDEGLGVHEVRSILDEDAAFLQSFAHEPPVTRILHVAHAAVNQLRRTGRRAGRKVLGLQHDGLEAAGGGVDRNAGARGAAADDDDVPVPLGIF